jgi:hypothetical protein
MRVALFRDMDANPDGPTGAGTVPGTRGLAPSLANKLDPNKSIWLLNVLRGMHTGITIFNAGGLTIAPNNPDNGIPHDPDVWIESDPSRDVRNIFFYARRMPKDHHVGNTCCIVEAWSSGTPGTGTPGPTLVQVWVDDFPSNTAGLIKLLGHSLCLDAADKDIPHYPFDNRATIPSTMTQEEVMGVITDEMTKNGALDHLVLNGHGFMNDKTGGSFRLGVGNGFTRANLDLWDRFNGRIRYIWIQGCSLANDDLLCANIAKRTGAWVTAQVWFQTSNIISTLPKSHIDYTDSPVEKHWNGNAAAVRSWNGTDDPPSGGWGTLVSPADDFFRSARQSPPKADLRSLFFNLTKRVNAPH